MILLCLDFMITVCIIISLCHSRVSMVNKKLWSAGRLHLPEVNIVRVGRCVFCRLDLGRK